MNWPLLCGLIVVGQRQNVGFVGSSSGKGSRKAKYFSVDRKKIRFEGIGDKPPDKPDIYMIITLLSIYKGEGSRCRVGRYAIDKPDIPTRFLMSPTDFSFPFSCKPRRTDLLCRVGYAAKS